MLHASSISRRQMLSLGGLTVASCALAACGQTAPPAFASAQFPGSSPDFWSLAWQGDRVNVFSYSPAGLAADRPIVMALHGHSRIADSLVRRWRPWADDLGFHLIVPHFDESHFPGDSYSMGGASMGEPGTRAIDALTMAFEQAKQRHGWTASDFGLFGHSAGAQLAHRYLMFAAPPVRSAVIAAAGWYTMPDPGKSWPYGLAGTGVDLAELDPVWQTKVLMLVGDQDTGRQDLRWTADAVEEGLTRIERGRNYFDRARYVAAMRSVPIDWRLEIVDDCAHEATPAINRAASFLA